ncbi:dUTP diphosphatase [Oceanobacillus sp. CF4.6]|uniref:dUTP diphosphatase n=1 Tax=Oceanobacillus sp. CF4.6 TaxID=3373080 RepID=UPI003EE6326E
MNLPKLFEIQAGLNYHIEKEKGLEGQDLIPQKILALQVELGELANELPEAFKFWSNKENNYDKALKEYVDGLHFILSIGLDLEFVNYPMIGNSPETKTISDMFLVTFEAINMFYRAYFSGNEDSTEIKYTIVFDTFITLGEMLGFTTEQTEQAYLDKNKINHERQLNGY